jgi:hypothetical protein
MAEAEEPEQHVASSSNPPDAAVWSALGAASREKADAFLERQSRLADIQIEDEKRERKIRHRSLRVHHASEVLKLCFEIAVGLVVLLVVSALGAMVWSATQDRDLVVDAFSVPPDVAQSGLTGAVLAGRVLDKLGTMETNTFSLAQSAGSNRGEVGEQVRVEIPQTGISLGELDRYLRQWLGHETRVSGDLVHTPKGLALTVRYGDAPGTTTEGSAADLDRLIGLTAEHVYAAARPKRLSFRSQQSAAPNSARSPILAGPISPMTTAIITTDSKKPNWRREPIPQTLQGGTTCRPLLPVWSRRNCR